MSVIGITIFRARNDVADLDELIPKRELLPWDSFRLRDGSLALAYHTRTPIKPPSWARFFEGIIAPDRLQTASSSALIAFQQNGIWYLVTFGYGRYLINQDLVEPSFGLRVTLNAVDPSRIRSIDRRRVDTVLRLTREQLSRDSRMGSFGLDVQRDLLNAVTGVPTDSRLGSRIYGKEAVGLRIEMEPRDLPSIAEVLEDFFQGDDYRKRYPWVDNITEVRDIEQVRRLDSGLVGALRKNAFHSFELAPPDLVDWSIAAGFAYGKGDELRTELVLEDYLRDMRPRSGVTADVLKKDRVQLQDGDGNRIGGWSVYRCLHGEVIQDGGVFVLSDGKWYRVDRDFAAEVDMAVRQLQSDGHELPPFARQDANEAAYNVRVAKESGGVLVCMDEKFIHPRSWQDRLELCDLFHKDRSLIHVKRYSRGSATLSHLFAQGSVSARCLVSDPEFLSQVDELVPPSHKFGGVVPKPSECTVVFAVIRRNPHSQLPCFSRVGLRNAADVIQGLGMRVQLQVVPSEA